MMNGYDDLYNLIARDVNAHQFFTALPDQVRQAISFRAQDVHSFANLQDCAQELLSDYD